MKHEVTSGAAMPTTEPSRRTRGSKARLAAGLTCGLAALGLLAACTTNGTQSTVPATGPSSHSSHAAAATAVITNTPAQNSSVNPRTPVTVDVANGKLTSVTMVNATGKHVTGRLNADGTTWSTTEVLGYGKTYTISARAVTASGTASTRVSKVSTLRPSRITNANMDRMGGYGLVGGATYGVAIVPVVHFDTAISDEAAAQKTLSVKASRKVDGVWSWIDDQDVAYRPRDYWPANTSVTVNANVYGVDLGQGLYGASDESATFTVGRKQLTVADDSAPAIDKVRVYNSAGVVLRTMDTSMGQHTGETVNGHYINFYTLDGTYTVLDHENPALMSSQSYGLPANAPNGYGTLSVPYSTKISTDGIYLHEYNSTQYDQEHGMDVSEGCLNLVTADAAWFFDHSMIGDPVVVHGAVGAPKIAPWEGGYWSIPWSAWVAKSA